MNVYEKGDVVRVKANFASTGGAALDPTAVTFSYQYPNASVVELVYGSSTRVVKTGTGAYYVDVDADIRGVTRWRWDSTGSGKAAHEGQFTVKAGLV